MQPLAPRIAAAAAIALASLLAAPVATAADGHDAPPVIESRIDTVGLFKNGLAVVRRTLELPGPGVFDVIELPEPVHGAFWVESNADLAIRMTEADVPRKNPGLGGDPERKALPAMTNQDLAGCIVTVFFKAEHLPAVTGRVVAPGREEREWDRSYGWSRPRHAWWWSGWDGPAVHQPGPAGVQSLVLDMKEDGGRVILDPSTIAYLRIDEQADIAMTRQPVMRIEAADWPIDEGRPLSVSIVYLSKGAAWAPSYALDASDDETLALRQKAVIRNELEDFDNVEILLITGFPGIEFGHVLSPISPASSLSSFFRALGTENRLSHSSRGDVMSQMVTNMPAPYVGGPTIVPPDFDLAGEDLHYHSIGRRSLAVGETLMLETAAADAPYERLVRFVVDEDRDWLSRSSNSWSHLNTRPEPWDVLRFDNPLDRPMTTAPVLTIRDGFVTGQSMIHWTRPGGEVLASASKALSVRGSLSESPRVNDRERIEYIRSHLFRTPIECELLLKNQRGASVTMLIEVDYQGELVKAEGDPTDTPRPDGGRNMSPARRLVWELELAPGEERAIRFEYTTLTHY
jgi:hypothetical protein